MEDDSESISIYDRHDCHNNLGCHNGRTGLMKHLQAYTNDKGSRLFSVVKIGRKWTTGIWWEYPVKVIRMHNKDAVEWAAIDKQEQATETLRAMAIKSHGDSESMPISLKRAIDG